jgi:hypothetical protein
MPPRQRRTCCYRHFSPSRDARNVVAAHDAGIAAALGGHMKILGLSFKLALLALPVTALAGGGLVPPQADALWPQWQARIALQTAAVTPLNRPSLLDGGTVQRSWQGGALLGDYYFATPAFGSFRASGGLMVGSTGGAPLLAAPALPGPGLQQRRLEQRAVADGRPRLGGRATLGRSRRRAGAVRQPGQGQGLARVAAVAGAAARLALRVLEALAPRCRARLPHTPFL